MQFSQYQIKNWRAFEAIRQSGAFNMFDPRARALSDMSPAEWVYCMEHYAELKSQANKSE